MRLCMAAGAAAGAASSVGRLTPVVCAQAVSPTRGKLSSARRCVASSPGRPLLSSTSVLSARKLVSLRGSPARVAVSSRPLTLVVRAMSSTGVQQEQDKHQDEEQAATPHDTFQEFWALLDTEIKPLILEATGALPLRTEYSIEQSSGAAGQVNQAHFASLDGSFQGDIWTYRGGPIDWLTTTSFWNGAMGFGLMRLDAWLKSPSQSSSPVPAPPHLQLEIAVLPGSILIYFDLPPRADLRLHDDYREHYYERSLPNVGPAAESTSSTGSINELVVEFIEDSQAFKPFVSKAAICRAFMTSPGTLCFTFQASTKSCARARLAATRMTRAFLAFLAEVETEAGGEANKALTVESNEVCQRDRVQREFFKVDPETKKFVGLFGDEAVTKMLKLLCGEVKVTNE
eukprot:jgi/Chlat1/4900/Chrsp31S04913